MENRRTSDSVRVEFIRTDRTRSVGFSVGYPDILYVHAPRRISRGALDVMAKERISWAERRLSRLRDTYEALGLPKRYEGGESYLYQGKPCTMTVLAEPGSGVRTKCVMDAGRLMVNLDPSDIDITVAVKKALHIWYKQAASDLIKQSVEGHAGRLGLAPASISVRNQKRRWGSCSRNGRLNFNWRLAMVPPELLDYVVAHELCHMIRPDHSARFWKLVEDAVPDHQKRRRGLREYEALLDMR